MAWKLCRSAAAVAISTALGVGAVGAAELLVVRSTAPEIKVGSIVDADQVLEIPERQAVTLVSDAGKAIRLEGPFAGEPGSPRAPGDGDPALLDRLRVLLEKSDTTSMGATRSSVHATGPADTPWASLPCPDT